MATGRIVVDPADINVSHEVVAGLPVVNAVLARLGFDSLLESYLPEPDARCGLEPARAIGVLVRNLALGRQPLYGIGAWASGYDPALLGLFAGEAAALNDDRVGRALDELFAADRASLMTALSLAAIRAYAISVDELHNDSTSICLYGAYRRATGQPAGGVTPPRPARGHSKDHRPDLKQLVWILTVSADGAVPICHQMVDGNTEDSTTHIATWDTCRDIAGRADFLYVADCKLATRDNMDHIAARDGRFLTVLPRTRKDDETGRAWLAAGPVDWAEIARRPGRRKTDPPEVWWAVPAPSCSAEGYRIVWVRSSSKRANDAAGRADRLERALGALGELATSLASARCRLKSRAAVEDTARALVADAGASRWVRFSVGEETTSQYRQERRGRPGPDTTYRRIDHRRFTLTFETDAARVAHDAASDGCFPFITNDNTISPAAMLHSYKAQPHLERRHATFKGVLEAAPVELKSDYRIDAFGFCLYVALLVHALIERELRNAMTAAGITDLPLYHEDRACKSPTAARVLELLDPLARTIVTHRDRLLALQQPNPSPLQQQILELLDIPTSPYGTA
ncbi:MAG: IS1634 family transposase [Microthrixaceae bacterium]|nr:IS1634 family transposase [Microthrixaceae bacterium]